MTTPPPHREAAPRQRDLFLATEGDHYFDRNSLKVVNQKNCDFFLQYIKPGNRILEIGCSSGSNLAYIRSVIDCEPHGIDPSRKAIEHGIGLHQNLHLAVGTSEELDYPSQYFDVVLFGFCLYLVDRDLLVKTIGEADRVLKSPGYLGITDFDVKTPKKRPYKHKPGVFSYKMDYPSLFSALPNYFMADKCSFSHSDFRFHEDPAERVASVVLFKNDLQAYALEAD